MTAHDQLAEANRKLLELERQKALIQEQINAWTQIRDGFGKLSKNGIQSETPSEDIGLTEAILVILGKCPEGLTRPEIRDRLLEYGISSKGKTPFIVNVHTILARLCAAKKVEKISENGKMVYRLKHK